MSRVAFQRIALVLFLVAIACLVRPRVARANGPPFPYGYWWFVPDEGPAEPPRLRGVQLVACEATSCTDPVLAQWYGDCDGAECLPIPTDSGTFRTLKCAGGRCRFSNHTFFGHRESTDRIRFRLIAQFSDRARVSNTVSPPEDWGEKTTVWRLSVRDDDLVLTLDPEYEAFGSTWDRFTQWLTTAVSGLFFTQLVEAPLAVLCLWLLFRKRSGTDLARAALMVFMINLVTFPIVWLFFPSLGQLQPTTVRVLGISGLVLALLFGVLLVSTYTAEPKSKRATRTAIFVLLPLTLLCSAAIWVLVWYGSSYQVAAMGLPPVAIVPVAELFAVLCEAGLLHVLHRRTLPLWRAGVTSLLMNAASFGLGLLVLGIWP